MIITVASNHTVHGETHLRPPELTNSLIDSSTTDQ